MGRILLPAVLIAILGVALAAPQTGCGKPVVDPRFPCGSPRWEYCPPGSGENPSNRSEKTCCPFDHKCVAGGGCAAGYDPDFNSGTPNVMASKQPKETTRQKREDGSFVPVAPDGGAK